MDCSFCSLINILTFTCISYLLRSSRACKRGGVSSTAGISSFYGTLRASRTPAVRKPVHGHARHLSVSAVRRMATKAENIHGRPEVRRPVDLTMTYGMDVKAPSRKPRSSLPSNALPIRSSPDVAVSKTICFRWSVEGIPCATKLSSCVMSPRSVDTSRLSRARRVSSRFRRRTP